MDFEKWAFYDVVGKHKYIKNKQAAAILITDENKYDLAKETEAFTVFDNGSMLLGVMHFARTPQMMICINPNPRSKRKKFLFESPEYFESKLLKDVLSEVQNG